MKKTIKVLLIGIFTISLLTGCGCSKKEEKPQDDVKTNTNEDVIKDQLIDGITMTNTSMVTTNKTTKLTTSVTNNTDKDYRLDEYMIIVKDEEGKEIVRIPGYVGDTIKAGETRTISSSVDIDLSKAASIEYEVKK